MDFHGGDHEDYSLLGVMLCSLTGTNILEESDAFIIRVEGTHNQTTLPHRKERQQVPLKGWYLSINHTINLRSLTANSNYTGFKTLLRLHYHW